MKKSMIVIAVGLMALASVANAASSIGLNMGTDQGGSLGSTDSAGVVAQFNWNNLANNSGSAGSLLNNSGVATTASVSWNANNTWHTYGNPTYADVPSAPDGKLMYGYLDNTYNNVFNPTVSLTGIPYSLYDVYVYFGTDNTGPQGAVTIGSTSYYFTTMGYASFAAFTITTDTTGTSNPEANYARFIGLTGSSFTVSTSVTYGPDGNPAGGILGLQIVQVPEPTAFALLALGVGGLALINRRRG